MKSYNGFEAKKASTGREQLPVGGYVCTIMKAEEEELSWGRRFKVSIDIAEGEYTGFWKKDYTGNDRDDKKWRGVLYLNVPKDDGSDIDNWNKRLFNNFIWAVQESNTGYVWDWDENKLKGKKVGVLYRNEEWILKDSGKTGWSTKAYTAASVEDIRTGNYKLPKDKPLSDKQKQAAGISTANEAPSGMVELNSDFPDDLPF